MYKGMILKRFILLGGIVFLSVMGHAHAGYNLPYVGDQIEYESDYEDTFVHIARDYNLGYVEMRAANPGVDPWLPGEGTDLILPTRHIFPEAPRQGIVINLPEMRLYAFVNGDNPPDTYPIGIGREGLDTPEGTTKIVRKRAGPEWRPTPRMRQEKPELPAVVEPGPENPLGTHALYLGWPQYAIHGTNRPFGIGRRISSGCIRLYPESITKLFEKVPVGTPVTVVDQPIKAAWIDDKLYIEAHPTISQSIQMEETGQIEPTQLSEKEMEYILKAADEFKDRLRWPAIRMAVKERRGYPVAVAWRPSSDYEQESAEVQVDEKEQDSPDYKAEVKAILEAHAIDAPQKETHQKNRTYNP